jgi:hypothetical protein
MEEHDCRTDKEREVIIEHIRQYGCHICLLEPTNYLPGFAYSIGLFERFKHPEIICFGLKNSVLSAVINHACELIKNGEILVAGKLYPDFLANYDIQFLPVNKSYYQNYLGYGGWYYQNSFEFPALQLVWPDKQSLYPWEQGFNNDWKFKQPLLDREVDFKFYEEKNLGVFTSSGVLNGEPILYAYHDRDGDWQFYSVESPALDDCKIMCLKDITRIDETVNNLFHLEYGWRAWRESENDEWEYEAYENEDVE